jgi:hypothetical protein
MTTKTYTVLDMEVVASDGETETMLRFTKDQDGAVEITMGGKFKTVNLSKDEGDVLAKFLSPDFGYSPNNTRGGDA